MSKCDIAVEFYRPDREFRTGQTIQGWIRVSVDKNLDCRALHLNVFWKTHGRGNTTRKNYFQQTLFQGEWLVGESYEYPFEFSPPLAPLTYHGRYLNIDHYVSVRADIPWAIDPRCEEEFMWRVGSEATDPGAGQPVLEGKGGCGRKAGLTLAALLLIGSAAMPLLGLSGWYLLLAIPALLVAFLSLRSLLSRHKLGDVKWGTLETGFAGESMPSLLQIGPVGNVKIKEVTATIYGIESVVSGSGTDATTHVHRLHEEHQVLVAAPTIRRGSLLELEPTILFPKTDAFSVNLPDNKIVWSVTIAIRLPWWPDWVQTREIVLVGRPQDKTDENPNPAFESLSLHELIGVAESLSRCGKDSAKISQAVSQNADHLYAVSIEVVRVFSADQTFDDPDYASGRAVSGKLSGSAFLITLQLPARYNQQTDSLTVGETWDGKGAILRWDSNENRLIMLGI